jgi:predicted amidohydrolase YtcJ
VTRLLIRRARLVPIGPTAAPPQHLVDILVEDGLVKTVATQLDPRPGVEEYDADGRWCAPGLWDQHVHLTQWTLASQRLDLAPARSPEEVLALVAERVTTLPGVPVVGWGHRPGHWPRDVTVSELDAVTGDTPVVLIAGDGHHAWLNTTALMHLAMPVRDSVVR